MASNSNILAGVQTIDDGGPDGSVFQGAILSKSADAASGYTTGAGGAVTQITSDSTAVTINKPCGTITTFALVLATAVDTSFVVNNSLVEANDVVIVSTKSYGGTADGIPIVSVEATADGSFTVNLMNNGAVTLDALAVLNFAIVKSVAA